MAGPSKVIVRDADKTFAIWMQRIHAGTHKYVTHLVSFLGDDEVITTYYFRKTNESVKEGVEVVGLHNVLELAQQRLKDNPRVSVQAYYDKKAVEAAERREKKYNEARQAADAAYALQAMQAAERAYSGHGAQAGLGYEMDHHYQQVEADPGVPQQAYGQPDQLAQINFIVPYQ